MSNCPFCNLDPVSSTDGKRGNGLVWRARRSVQWLFPATLLVLTPKCPMCVAAYVALFTGVGISMSTARWIQISMPVLYISSLLYLIVRHCRLLMSKRSGRAS